MHDRGRDRPKLLPLHFQATIFLGAFLLFLIQPLFTRLLVPLLGGSPSVWNTAMVFYQSLLLGGYALAHLMSQSRHPRRMVVIHVALICLAWINLPPGLNRIGQPDPEGFPMIWVLTGLALGVGPLFVVLSTISPLLQSWFSKLPETRQANPYHLYSASNAGSLLALAAYPLIFEPFFNLKQHAIIFTAFYGVFFLLMLGIAVKIWFYRTEPTSVHEQDSIGKHETVNLPSPKPGTWLEWIALAIAPSSLMLGVTTYITTDLASVPMLWILPLSLYLSTFIIAFSPRVWISHRTLLRGYPMVACPFVLALASGSSEPMSLLVGLHLLHFWWLSLLCHTRLVAKRPSPVHLTQFYLCLSIGGALGGVFNAILAPVLFPGLWEYPIAIAFGMWMGFRLMDTSADPRQLAGRDWFGILAMGLVMALLIGFSQSLGLPSDKGTYLLLFGLPVIACFYFSALNGRFALMTSTVLIAGLFWQGDKGVTLYQKRTFYGLHRVTVDPTKNFLQLLHGQTIHGWQGINDTRKPTPLTYFHPTGPFGQIIEKTKAATLKKAGVVGLGAGSLAAYAKEGQEWTFFEIDPEVIHIARDLGYFKFLSQSKADLRYVTGDARLTLQKTEPGTFDLLVMDAYSSDAIPIHLLTLEAVTLYIQKLTDQGILAFHISNRNLDLEYVLAAIADELGLHARIHDEIHLTDREYKIGKKDSKWVVMTTKFENFGILPKDSRWHPLEHREGTVPWTDDFSSILDTLNWF